jgi:hypothetical protein
MAKEKDYWRQVVETTLQQLAELRAARDEKDVELQEMDTEIMQLEQLLTSLAPFTSEPPVEVPGSVVVEDIRSMSLADASREILRASGQWRTARGVRDSLKASGYDLSQHNNPLASIHGVLKRMYDSGEVGQLVAKGRTFYRMKVNMRHVVQPEPAGLKITAYAPKVVLGATKKGKQGSAEYEPIAMVDEEGKPKNVVK